MKKILQSALLVFLSMTVFHVQAETFKEGVHYHAISPAQTTSTGDKIEVTELFWYGCSHCHRFEPHLEKWLSTVKDDVEFRGMPAIFSDRWELLARAFYVAEILGIKDKVHPALFHAIHEAKKRMTRKDHVMTFFSEYGVSADQFNKAYRSFAVESKVNYARKMSRSYQISGTPSLVINGKYRIEPGKGVGFEEMIKIADFLIEKERAL